MNYTQALTIQSFIIIDALYEYCMTEIVISPGSRSTPLAIAAELHEGIKTYIHPDERGAGYFAAGLTKKRRQPVGMLCTSGTAAANYTPAVAEAGLSHLPLVVVTSDRPDRKSTRLNSSHVSISYAVFCLKKKKRSNKTRIVNKQNNERPSTEL